MSRLGDLFRERRDRLAWLGWDSIAAETGLKERASRTYESGGVTPPIDKALLLSECYGIELKELAEAVLGRPYEPRRPTSVPPEDEPNAASAAGVVADAARVLPARARERRPRGPAPQSRRVSRPAPGE